jgi:CRISPR system Cascade subunit CasC
MSRFVQLHVLTAYPPANLNRDDTGRPKTALLGDAQRLRISSQSLKRAWRTSDVFETTLGRDHLGQRTKRLGIELHAVLTQAGVADKQAREWARARSPGQFGKLKADKLTDASDDLQIEQLAHVGPDERAAAETLAKSCATRKSAPSDDDELKLLRKPREAVDIAMFGPHAGRHAGPSMSRPRCRLPTPSPCTRPRSRDDYFSAVDDLNAGLEDKGAGHIGERGYGAGLFYLYLCIDRELLRDNLGGDADLAGRGAAGAAARGRAGCPHRHAKQLWLARLRELPARREGQPAAALAGAGLPQAGAPLGASTTCCRSRCRALQQRLANFDKVYGACADSRCQFDCEKGEGSLAEVVAFVKE